MLIDTAFPGGNVSINSVQDDHIHFGPDVRENQSTWFYWYFRIRNAAGRTLHFHPYRKNLLTSHAPATSVDGGRQWAWADPACVCREDDSFTLTVPADVEDWRVCMTIPYTPEHLATFIGHHQDRLPTEELCQTARGVSVPLWRLGPSPESAAHRVLITARHHCCEAMASYVVEGIVEAVLADDALGRWWQQHASLTVVPFVDWDGVAAGDQGKNRLPRDHNRDYDASPIHPQTPAIQQQVHHLATHGLAAAIDLHCPWIHGLHSEEIYMVGVPDDQHQEHQETWAIQLERSITGPLPYHHQDNIPFGQAWNTASNYAGGCSFTHWTRQQPGVSMCTAMEIPYALVHGHVIDADAARSFGKDMARALQAWLPSDQTLAKGL